MKLWKDQGVGENDETVVCRLDIKTKKEGEEVVRVTTSPLSKLACSGVWSVTDEPRGMSILVVDAIMVGQQWFLAQEERKKVLGLAKARICEARKENWD